MIINMPPRVSEIISRLNAGGYEAYIVGGCVRDSIMQKEPKDWDVTTEAAPDEVKRLFPRTHDTGIAHGTVTVVMGGRSFEITTFRVDGEYFDKRHPENVTFTRSLREDLLRRDFTMNAIAYHKDTGFVDPFGGMEDISAGLVRGVGDPSRRFNEDALRMLRAIRFAAQLGFEIESETWNALVENACLIKNISLERVRDEFLKLLMSDPNKISLLSASGLMAHIDPELAEHIKSADLRALSLAGEEIRLAALLRGLSGTKARLRHFRLDNKTIGLVTTLLAEIENPILDDYMSIRRRLSKIGPETFLILIGMFEAYGGNMDGIREKTSEILSRGDCIRLSELAINGDALKALGITEGREIGRTLELLLEHVLEFPQDNTRQRLINVLDGLCFPENFK